MGGWFSGRHGGWPTVEACDTLVISVDDITRPIRKAMRKLGVHTIAEGRVVELPWRSCQWTRSGDDEPCAEVEYQLDLNADGGRVRLRYDVEQYTGRTGPQEHAISMTTTPCPFGGKRWWWICPATGRLVRKLYLPNGGTRFLSRGPGGYSLAYRSQRRGRVDRIHAQNRRLYRLLDADYDGLTNNGWPPKPKGMRWRTYNAICERLEVQEGRLVADFLWVLARR